MPPKEPDRTAPTLVARVPEAGAENVWAGAPVRLTFSEPLSPATVTASAVTVRSGESPLAAETTLSADGREIRVVLSSPRLGPAELSVTVAGTITDVAGNAFGGATWSWKVPRWQQPGGAPAASGAGPLRPALALDSGQNPVVAWQEAAAGKTAIRVARFDGGMWQPLGDALSADGSAAAVSPRVAVGPNDQPIVAWQEPASDASHVYVMGYRDGKWALLGTGPVDAGTGTAAKEPALVLDGERRPVVAWIEDDAGVFIRRWDGNAWQPVGQPWTTVERIDQLDLAFAGADPILAVTVNGGASFDVRVVRWQSAAGNWELMGPPLDRAFDHDAKRPSLAVFAMGMVAVAWQENDGYSDNVYAAHYDPALGNWQLWGAAVDIDFDRPAEGPSLALTQEGKPVLAFSEAGPAGARSYVGWWTGTRWEVPGAGLEIDSSGTVESTRLVVDDAGNPVVVWEEQASLADAPSQLLAKRYNGSPDLPFGLTERRPPPCAFPEDEAPDFPRTLSQTKCFSDVARRVPAPGLIPYDLNSPLWSDGALKQRYLALPEGASFGFRELDAWRTPIGTILVKEFLLEREPGNPATIYPLETRFLVKRCEPGLCRASWQGYSYQWNDEGTEAVLLENEITIFKDWPTGPVMHKHSYPGREECNQCHTVAAGGVLGLQTPQLNRNYDYGGVVDNQLRALARIGLFGNRFGGGGVLDGGATDAGSPDGDSADASSLDATSLDAGGSESGSVDGGSIDPAFLDALTRLPRPSDAAHSKTERVRSYFHSNCSNCHRSDGRWPVIDFRYEMPMVGAAEPNANICNELIPGDAARSRIYFKDAVRAPNLPPGFTGLPMPPLASIVPDERQLPVLKAWIDEMKSCP